MNSQIEEVHRTRSGKGPELSCCPSGVGMKPAFFSECAHQPKAHQIPITDVFYGFHDMGLVE